MTGRVLGVDVGTVRTGLAVSDPARLVATPAETIQTGGAAPDTRDLSALAAWADRLAERLRAAASERSCETVVVGLPRSLSGHDTPSTALARAVVAALGRAGLRADTWDERLSTVEVERALAVTGRARGRRRVARDPLAATLVLQGWLDAHRCR